ncbi:MBL fold metallo-hydrolase [Stappia sp. F7233]|uniref:MBL fold metallo-hydrolase n=1 Tax=Stappia albiluteola TaxID=2758565 RepID=A0A839AK49_9HYPH|nr:MBL fold metallo-hydrolase [Stappia albiluteola]MBA5779374.1 MBL fold metallo-hydrolase [Stappia albiluteola]
MGESFASVGDTEERSTNFREVGRDCYAYTAVGDPSSGVVVGEKEVVVIDTQPTPARAEILLARIREIADVPVRRVVLTHFHATRTLGATVFGASEILCSDLTRHLISERGKQDLESEAGRFPRLFRDAKTIPGLTWPTTTFSSSLTMWLGNREVRLMNLGRGHTMGDIVCFVPDAGVLYAGDLVENASAPYCGDGHIADWLRTLERLRAFKAEALVPGRGEPIRGTEAVHEAIDLTRDYLETLQETVKGAVERKFSLEDTYRAAEQVMGPDFSGLALFGHRLPFNVARAYDEAKKIGHPRIWTAERDREIWHLFQTVAAMDDVVPEEDYEVTGEEAGNTQGRDDKSEKALKALEEEFEEDAREAVD